MPADLEKLAYESALRALDKQERLVEELRARAGIILAAWSLAISLLGRRGFPGPAGGGLLLLAIASFGASVAAAVFVLLPKKGLAFSMSARSVIEDLSEFRDAREELFGRAALILDQTWDANDSTIQRLSRGLSIAAIGLIAEIAALIVKLGGTVV